jgi:hypothetical protein
MEELWMGEDVEAGSDDEALGPVVECIKGAITCCKSMIEVDNIFFYCLAMSVGAHVREQLKGGTSNDLSQYA